MKIFDDTHINKILFYAVRTGDDTKQALLDVLSLIETKDKSAERNLRLYQDGLIQLCEQTHSFVFGALQSMKKLLLVIPSNENFSVWFNAFVDIAVEANIYAASTFESITYVVDDFSEKEINDDLLNKLMFINSRAKDEAYKTFNFLSYIFFGYKGETSRLELFEDFIAMIKESDNEFKGHSAGFEVEFFSSGDEAEEFEVQLGPFTKIEPVKTALNYAMQFTNLETDSPLSTLHITWGTTQIQRNNFFQHEQVYEGLIRKMSYIANSAARNNWRAGELVIEHDAKRFKPFDSQTGCLQSRQFGLSPDTDLEMLSLIVETVWQCLDQPDRAIQLDQKLNDFFKSNKIDILMLPLDEDDDHEALEKWESDFGLLMPLCNPDGSIDSWVTEGRVVRHRPAIRAMLDSFIASAPKFDPTSDNFEKSRFNGPCRKMSKLSSPKP